MVMPMVMMMSMCMLFLITMKGIMGRFTPHQHSEPHEQQRQQTGNQFPKSAG